MSSAVYTPTIISTEEITLISQILDGRRDLFGELIAPYLKLLFRIVQSRIGAHADVEDIIQQTALKALNHLGQFRFEASFRTWLIQISLNETRQWLRERASSRIIALDRFTLTQLPAADESASPLSECQRSEATVRLRTALARLPEKYRRIILLRDFEEFSISEVAQQLKLTIPAVKTRHRRARQKIARSLTVELFRIRRPIEDCLEILRESPVCLVPRRAKSGRVVK